MKVRNPHIYSTAPDEIEYEDLNYYYANYSRQVEPFTFLEAFVDFTPNSIYNDVITLRKGSGYMSASFVPEVDLLTSTLIAGPSFPFPMRSLNQSRYPW